VRSSIERDPYRDTKQLRMKCKAYAMLNKVFWTPSATFLGPQAVDMRCGGCAAMTVAIEDAIQVTVSDIVKDV